MKQSFKLFLTVTKKLLNVSKIPVKKFYSSLISHHISLFFFVKSYVYIAHTCKEKQNQTVLVLCVIYIYYYNWSVKKNACCLSSLRFTSFSISVRIECIKNVIDK